MFILDVEWVFRNNATKVDVGFVRRIDAVSGARQNKWQSTNRDTPRSDVLTAK